MKTLPRSGSSVVLAALLASGCGGDLIGPSDAGSVRPLDCSVIGCGESIRLPGLVTLSGAEMRAITVYLCRNGTCVMGTPARLPEQPAVGFGCELPPDANSHCVVWNVSPDRYRLDVAFGNSIGARDGDTFVVRVSHPPSGTVLAEAAESVRYTTSTPNGPSCGPVCHHATLTPITRALPGSDGGGCAMNRCEAAPLVALGTTLRLNTCGCAIAPAGICGGAHPRAFFRVDAPLGEPLHFTTGTAQITAWDQCGDPAPAQCGGLSGSFVTTRNETRLFGVERFTECGEVAITVTR